MFAVWFIFENDDQKHLSQIIKKLSMQYDAPVFLPHITAYGLVDTRLDTLDKIVSNSIKGEKPFTVEKKSISYSDDFWKAIFVEIHPNKELVRINDRLTKSLGSFGKYEIKPHASLIYKEMNPDQKKKLAESLDVKNRFKINGICIQQFSEDISKWMIVRQYNLDES